MLLILLHLKACSADDAKEEDNPSDETCGSSDEDASAGKQQF